MRRVVVTGLGMVAPVGNNIHEAWQYIVQGSTGVGRVTRFEAENLP